jgi:hypothetical protein
VVADLPLYRTWFRRPRSKRWLRGMLSEMPGAGQRVLLAMYGASIMRRFQVLNLPEGCDPNKQQPASDCA